MGRTRHTPIPKRTIAALPKRVLKQAPPAIPILDRPPLEPTGQASCRGFTIVNPKEGSSMPSYKTILNNDSPFFAPPPSFDPSSPPPLTPSVPETPGSCPPTKKRKIKKEEENVKPMTFVWKPERTAEWVKQDDSSSVKKGKHKTLYRCDLCFVKDRIVITTAPGDLQRHLLSLAHKPKSFFCTQAGCNKSYTREDAVKRHLKKCRSSTKRRAPS